MQMLSVSSSVVSPRYDKELSLWKGRGKERNRERKKQRKIKVMEGKKKERRYQ
jgi:hypothetical protein